MSEPASTPRWQVVALVGRVRSREILVSDGDGTPTLPVVADGLAIEPYDAEAFPAIAARLGVPIGPVRQDWRPNSDWTAGVIVATTEPLDAAPDGYRWLDPTAATALLEPAGAREVVRRYVERHGGPPTPFEASWARAGWFDRAATWMVERMAEAGEPATAAPRLVYHGPLAAVLRATTKGEAMFLKCAAPAFPHEATITAALARRSPGRVTDVVAIEAAEDWLLMRDHGGRLLEEAPPSAWPGAMTSVAGLQRSWIGHGDELSAARAPSRRLGELAAAVPTLLERNGLGGRLPTDLRATWDGAVGRLVDACLALDDLGIPDALIHGDLHPGNIVIGRDGPVVVDWSDGAFGNPFVDLPTFLLRVDDMALRDRLVAAYLDGWDGIAPRARLATVAPLAMAVGGLYQIATYQALLPAMDAPDRALFDGVDVAWVRRTLDGLERGLRAPAVELG